jgi:hypothetical protein
MARYFLHFHDGTDQADHTGTELAGYKAARDAAVVFMGDKLKELDGDFWPEGPNAEEMSSRLCAIRKRAVDRRT